jgi:NAD+ kinase
MPDGDMMVITPVSPHSLHTRPWVISARDTVRIDTDPDLEGQAAVALDGEVRLHLNGGESLAVRRSDYTATILKTSPLHFYEVLRRKIR